MNGDPDRALRRTLDACGAIGLAAGVRVFATYWDGGGSLFLRAKSGIWVALARDAAHGELYRPLVSASGYGGTRYMPLLFLVHGALIRAGFDAIGSGVVLMQLTVAAAAAALFVALRAVHAPVRLAAPMATLVWGTIVFQQSCTDLGPDYLAAAFALAGAAIATREDALARPSLRVVPASGLFVLAALTKITAAVFALSVVLFLWFAGRRRWAIRVGAATTVLLAAALAATEILSDGHFHESFIEAAADGATWSAVWRAVPKFAWEIAIKPFDVGVPCAIAVWCVWKGGPRSWTHWYFVTAAFAAIAIFTSPGTASNHLVDLHMAATLVVGSALAHGVLPARAGVAAYAAAAAMLLAIGIPVPRVPSVVADVKAAGARPRASAESIHAEFLSRGPYLSIDPIVPILDGERPWLLDYGTAERSFTSGGAVGRDLAARVRQRFFAAIVVPETGAFTRDMTRGDVGFERSAAQFWSDYDSPLAPLFRSAYVVQASRHPFVVLVPARD